MKGCSIGVAMAVFLLLGAACSSPEQEPQQGTAEERTGSDLAELLNEPAYTTLSDGALEIQVPPAWNDVLTGEDSEAGSSWSSFLGEGIGSSITASTDLDAWHNASGAPGTYVVAAPRSSTEGYTDDQLVEIGPHDFSSSCEPGARRDFERPPYAGKMQAWEDCGGNDEARFLTLAAAPEDRECVVLLQIGMYGEDDVEQHILDTLEADCSSLPSYAPGPTAPEPDLKTVPGSGSVPATGVLEKPEVTTYMYGTHTITDEASGTRYALRSEEEGLLDGYVGERVTVYGTLVPGYENDQVEGGPPLLDVSRVEPV